MNLVELMRQAVGEYEEKFCEKELELVQNIPMDRVVINADGRRIFRIIDNIMNNIDKYAQPGTRVYIDMKAEYSEESAVDNSIEDVNESISEEDSSKEDSCIGNVTISFKNVSSRMLNISPEELMERFVRGDESRTTEGSGLGLSIAKNLTQLHGIGRVQVPGRLVSKENIGRRHQRSRDGNPLLLSAGQRVRTMRASFRDFQTGQ